jgi:hypothetical protein
MPLTSYGHSLMLGVSFGLQEPPSAYQIALSREPYPRNFDEPTGGYERLVVPTSDEYWKLTEFFLTNACDLFYPTATESWSTIRSWVLLNDDDGQAVGWSLMSVPRPVNEGHTVGFFAGELVLMFEELL